MKLLAILTLNFALLCAQSTFAGGLLSAAAKAAGERVLERTTERAAERTAERAAGRNSERLTHAYEFDRARDAATPARPAARERTVQRFTSSENAVRERQSGIPAGSHMSSNVPRGRGVTAERAQQRYGLRQEPTVVTTIRVPPGQPVRSNRVVGGEAGRGELTSTKRIAPKNIIQTRKLRRKKSND